MKYFLITIALFILSISGLTKNIHLVQALEVGYRGDTTYVPLVEIPGVTDQSVTNQDIGPYIAGAYKWAISLSILLAVVVFTFQAFRYLLSESTITSKSQAKEAMQNVIIGLLLIFTAYIILQAINPALVNFNLNILNPGMAKVGSTTPAGQQPCAVDNTATGETTRPTTPGIYITGFKLCHQNDGSTSSVTTYRRYSGTSLNQCKAENNDKCFGFNDKTNFKIKEKIDLTNPNGGSETSDNEYPDGKGQGWPDMGSCQYQITLKNYGFIRNKVQYCADKINDGYVSCTITQWCVAGL